MGANSRNKGSGFERAIARDLEAITGVKFERNLEQVRSAAQGDLTPSDPAFPFLIECKRYAAGTNCLTAWKVQASAAAAMSSKIAAVIFKFDRQPVRVAVPLASLCAGADHTEWAEITLSGLAYVAQEMMAANVQD